MLTKSPPDGSPTIGSGNAGSPLVELRGAGVRRDGRWLVRGIDLGIARGEIVTLIGPNGSGKSTTAKMVTGLIKPDEGSIERQSMTIGYVPQKMVVDWTLPLTVSRLMSLTGRQPRAAVEEALTAVGIPHLAGSQVHTLSGGEFQRALLARAILRKPDLLVLDEPVQGVDFAGEAALYDLIQQIRRTTGCAILMISHDLHVVMAGTDTVLCLNGHVCCRGTPEIVASSEEYRRLFGPRAAGALAIYRHDHDHTHLPDGRVRHADGSITAHCHPDDGHHHDHGHSDAAGHAHGPADGKGTKDAR